jgi:hypothetical protein
VISCVTITEDLESSTSNALTNDPSKLAKNEDNVCSPSQQQNLRKLYLLQQQQLLDLEQCQLLSETDTAKLKHMKDNFSSLQERILNWAMNAIEEKFEISSEEDAHVPKFVESDYLLLKVSNKVLRAAVASRDKSLADLKEKMEFNLEYRDAKGEELKIKVKALEEQNAELKKALSKKESEIEASKNNLSVEVEKVINSLVVEKAMLTKQLSDSHKSQANLEEKISKSNEMIKKAWEERKADKSLANSLVKQLRNTNLKLKSHQELEKGYKLMLRKMKNGKNNLFLHPPSVNDGNLETIEVVISQPHSVPTTAAASFDPRQDLNGEHSVSPMEAAQIMIVVESDDEDQQVDEVSEELCDVASGDEACDQSLS